MGAWQPLPDELPSEAKHFVEQLRLLKDRTGLSLVALGARTAYSKSSWQRYLNGNQPPPRQAVVALCRVAGEDAERFAIRWERAVRVWPRPAPTAAPDATAASGTTAVSDGAVREYGALVSEAVPAHSGDQYEDDPTLPWWDTPEDQPRPRQPGRLALYAALAVLVLLATVLIGAVTSA
ncbi:helix-turn-helix domain-containing protein [Streptomyces phyllanthi]|uniref:Helix-turn-helix domain-containing protein n=1 Tax=Streptomyces phyllanthi TaxID=1803180 RepID=A0A5N8WCW7_9ACTN|nr:helix-turn-helix transcriptional regulator [Streptomyces phyllanthi]MPY45311.1 helix-turn-helix domain-containing protein [Streptomyces phyllanthi]